MRDPLPRRGGAVLAAAVAVMAASPPAFGWGDEGHQITAIIAYARLTDAARTVVDRMLAADPDPLTAPDFASRATWADKFRDSDRNTTREHYRLTRQWHFVDIELDGPDLATACFGHPAPPSIASSGPANACVSDRIGDFAAELRDLPADDPERAPALKYLLHFVGDIHQPLHAADNHDAGGNAVMVAWGQRTIGKPLHAYWDTDVVHRLGHDPATVAAMLDRDLGDRCEGWMSGTPSDWAQESFLIAKDVTYRLGGDTGVDEAGKPIVRLSPDYERAAEITASEQLEKAGCRLAMILNAVLPAAPTQ